MIPTTALINGRPLASYTPQQLRGVRALITCESPNDQRECDRIMALIRPFIRDEQKQSFAEAVLVPLIETETSQKALECVDFLNTFNTGPNDQRFVFEVQDRPEGDTAEKTARKVILTLPNETMNT